MLHPNQQAQPILGYFNADIVAKQSSWPHVDFPVEAINGADDDWDYELPIWNPLALTAVNESEAWIEFDDGATFSRSAADTPHNSGTVLDEHQWRVVEIGADRAWARARKTGGDWFPVEDPSDAASNGYVRDSIRYNPQWDRLPSGDQRARQLHKRPRAGRSTSRGSHLRSGLNRIGVLGPPATIDFVEFAAFNDGCGLTLQYGQAQAFCYVQGGQDNQQLPLKDVEVFTGVASGSGDGCDLFFAAATIKVCDFAPAAGSEISIARTRVKVVTDVYSSGNEICYTEQYVYVCRAEGGTGGCIDICDLICDCYSSYAQPEFCEPPPPPPCESQFCGYVFNLAELRWDLDQPCPQLVDCECPPPHHLIHSTRRPMARKHRSITVEATHRRRIVNLLLVRIAVNTPMVFPCSHQHTVAHRQRQRQ